MSTATHVTMFEAMARRRGQRKGNLIDRGGSWLLRYWVDQPEIDEATGRAKRERVTVTIGSSAGQNAIGKREARRIAWEEWLSKLDVAHTRPSSAKTFLEFVNLRYRPDVIENLKPATQAFSESILRRHVIPMLGATPLREISPAHVQAVINAKRKQNLSVQTLTHIRNRIGGVLRHAKSHGWFFGEIPTTAVRMPEMQREEMQSLSWEQVCELSLVLPEPCATLILFLTLTGLRIGEAMGLRWGRLNLSDTSVNRGGEALPPFSLLVRENYVMGRYQTLKTGTSYRAVPIPEWFVPRMTALIGGRTVAEGTEPVFANLGGTVPMDQHNLAARVLKPASRKLKLGWVSWHVFRHTHNTMTEPLLTVAERMKIMGHSSAAVNMGYTHPEMESVRTKMAPAFNQKWLNKVDSGQQLDREAQDHSVIVH